MARLTTLLLAAALSGVPVAAVACDILFCAAADTGAQECHEHGGPGKGNVMAAADGGCVHLAVSSPFVPAPSRESSDALARVAAHVPATRPAGGAPPAGRITGCCGPPVPTHAPRPLRI